VVVRDELLWKLPSSPHWQGQKIERGVRREVCHFAVWKADAPQQHLDG
jgi:hypothetical protein